MSRVSRKTVKRLQHVFRRRSCDVVQKQWKTKRLISERMSKKKVRTASSVFALPGVRHAWFIYSRLGTAFTDNSGSPVSLSNRANSAFGVCRSGAIALFARLVAGSFDILEHTVRVIYHDAVLPCSPMLLCKLLISMAVVVHRSLYSRHRSSTSPFFKLIYICLSIKIY